MNYEQEVKKVYPDAVCIFEGVGYAIYNNGAKVSYLQATKGRAWEHAHMWIAEQSTAITVTGCRNCPLNRYNNHHTCLHPLQANPEHLYSDKLFATCPLKTNSITITLAPNEIHQDRKTDN